MEPTFWRGKWERGEIGFHGSAPNALMTRHFAALGLSPGARVFVPLCGKSLDLHWLLAAGFRVAGAELSPLAVDQLFEELGVVPEITAEGPLTRFEAEGIVLHRGDIFDLAPAAVGPVDAVYDRAALVALPAELRGRYAAHVAALSGVAPQLLITYDYDQNAMAGPPFAVPETELRRLYEDRYEIDLLERRAAEGGLRGGAATEESVWLLRPRR